MKILHAPRNPAAIATGLAVGERQLGHESKVLSLYREFTHYAGEQCLDLGSRGRLGRFAGHVGAFLDHRTGYDVYNFFGGSTFLHYPRRGLSLLDLPLIDRDATVVFTYAGSDARSVWGHRSGRLRRSLEESHGGLPSRRALERAEASSRRSIEKAARRADHFFAANPDLLRLLPEGSSFLAYPLPDFDRLGEHQPRFFADDKVHIVHAPTRRELKGTRFVLEAIERLGSEIGERFRFTLVESVSHDEATRRFRDADLFIDQLLIGWYGMAAAEVMRMGIPVVAFIDEEDLARVPSDMARDLPVVRADPSSLTAVLRELVAERERLIELGRRSRAFAEAWHDPLAVARQAVERYQR